MRTLALALTFTALSSTAVLAQTGNTTQTPTQQERVQSILGALFGTQPGATTGGTTGEFSALDAQWAIGLSPLNTQRAQFETRIDNDVRAGTLGAAAGDRAKADYRALVDLEARYGADRRFTAEERAELNQRYNSLTQVIAEGGYAGGVSGGTSAADGRAAFEKRVDDAVLQRRLTRTQATQLKTEYAGIVSLEATYLRDGVLSVRERDDLESRLDAIDAKTPDLTPVTQPTQPVTPATPVERLDAVARILPSAGLSTTLQAQLRVEHEDVRRLAAAYARLTTTADEKAYLERRLVELETRVGLRR